MTGVAGTETLRPVAVNMLGLVEQPEFGDSPYRVSCDGHPYVPAGDGGIVLGVGLGESVFARAADHAAPGACLVHPDQAARHALTIYSCIGNQVVVRTGQAAGARGIVVGKRGEAGRVIISLPQDDLARLRPADQVTVRAIGQGWRPDGFPPEVTVLNTDPAAFAALPVGARNGVVSAGVRLTVPSKLAGNGIGRPPLAGTSTCSCPGRLRPASTRGPARQPAASCSATSWRLPILMPGGTWVTGEAG